MQSGRLTARTPAGAIGENTAKHWANADADTQGAHYNPLEKRYLVKADHVSDYCQSALEKTGSTKPQECATEYEDRRAWSRGADDGSHLMILARVCLA